MNDGVHTLDIEKLSDYLTQQLDEFTGIKKSKKFNTGCLLYTSDAADE